MTDNIRNIPEVSVSRTSRLRPLVLLPLVLALTVLGACTSSGATSASSGGTAGAAGTPVRLGFFPNITHAPALVGVEQGLFAKELGSTPLETKSFNAGPAAVEALFGDALDITYIGPNPSINAYQKSKGEAVRIVSGSTSGGAYFVVKPEITSAQDLKGKTVASPQLGNTQDVALRSWLKQQGLSTDASGGGDVSIKPQENADSLSAFKAGQIAGAWVPEPWATRLVQEGGGKVLVDEKTLWPEGKYVTTNILVRKAFLDEHPDLVKKVLQGHLASLDEIAKNPADAQKAANDQIEKLTQKRLPDSVVTASWPNLAFTYDPLAATLQKSANDAKAVGQLQDTNLSGIYDLKILNELLKAKGQPEAKGL
ncbi:MAG: ABC transporter substrate-binding protein [Acidimicrobiales bacterium]